MADPAKNQWGHMSGLFQSAANEALKEMPHDLSPKTRLVFVPTVDGAKVVTHPKDNPAQVKLDPVHERVREVATVSDPRVRTLAIQSAATAAVFQGLQQSASFSGEGRIHGDHVVVPLVDLDPEAYSRCPALQKNQLGPLRVPQGLADTLVDVLLEEATSELSKPEPGGDINDCMKLEPGATRLRAARRLLGRVAVSIGAPQLMGKLFDDLSTIASLRYESQVGRGGVLLAQLGHPGVRQDALFVDPVPLRRATWARKILQLATPSTSVLCHELGLFGLGVKDKYDPTLENLFEVLFVEHHRWHLRHDDTVLLDVHYGDPSLPKPRLEEADFTGAVEGVFGKGDSDPKTLWRLASAAVEAQHGALLVVSERAADEAKRLKGQSMPIEPLAGEPQLVKAFSEVDGAILIDPSGQIHAFGVILDGQASERGTPARGARYNSSLRYVDAADHKVLALVVSEDGHVDPIVPLT